MSAVQQTAVLDEPTVQKIATGEVEPKKRKRETETRPRTSKAATTLVLNKQLTKMIKDLDIPIGLVQIVSSNEIIIRNSPGPW